MARPFPPTLGEGAVSNRSEEWVEIYDPVALRRALEDGDDEDYVADGFPTQAPTRTTENEVWARCLSKILHDPRGSRRPALFGTEAMAQDLTCAAAPMSHFGAVTGIIERAVIQSARAGRPLRFPPILMISPPGIGKTFYARTIAAALSTTVVPIAISMTSDRGSLGGLTQAWRGAKLGRLATGLLIDSTTAAPLFVLDELDKVPALLQGERTLDVLLMAMEPENAAAFVDEYFELPIRLDHALWLASANDTDRIPVPLLSRMVVLEVPAPTADQAAAMIRAIASPILASSGLDAIAGDAFEVLLGLNPRRARQTIELAAGYTVYDHRLTLSADDVLRSLRLVGDRDRRAMGFVR